MMRKGDYPVRILFVTRKFPPSTGGMENAAYELYMALTAHTDNQVTLVKWGGSNKWLPIIYFKLMFQAIWYGFRRKPEVVYLQDGVMAPLGWVVKKVVGKPTVISVHGKEATYKSG